ncbi:MAG: hypothetical protein EAZ99_00845 [Alphaproteobacteria bacterium]|nr:MAG: hypothetical protein EAZ99_00845 [Alphaproteobacteria bacterium]
MSRISDFTNQQRTLFQIRNNNVSLADLQYQLSTKTKGPTFDTIATGTQSLLNVNALRSNAEGYTSTIDDATTRLTLTDTVLSSARNLAQDVRKTLVQQGSNGGVPNFAGQANGYLAALESLMNTKDGSGRYVLSGSRYYDQPIQQATTVPRLPTTSLGLTANLTGATANTQRAGSPTPGSFLDAQVNTVFDSTGTAYNVSVRYVREANTGTNDWRLYITDVTRASDGSKATNANGTISADNPILATPALFNASNPAAGNLATGLDLNAAGVTLPSAGNLVLNIQGQGPGGAAISSATGTNLIQTQTAVTATSRITMTGALDTLAGVGTQITQTVNDVYDDQGRRLQLQVRFTKELTAGNPGEQARSLVTNALGVIRNRMIDGNISPPSALDASLAWADPFFTGLEVNQAAVDATYPAGTANIPFDVWRSEIVSVTNAATGANAATTPLPIPVATVYGTAGGANVAGAITVNTTGAGIDGTGATGAVVAGSFTIPTGAFGMQVGSPTGSATSPQQFTSVTVPPATLGTQSIRLGGRFDPAAPVNTSVSAPTPGSFVDITYSGSEALLDSGLKGHNLTIRFVKEQAGAGATWRAYAISMTQQSNGEASTTPAISAASPVAIGGLFDPTTATSIGPFAPTLRNANTISTSLQVPAGALANANITANTAMRAENTTMPANTLASTAQTVRLAGNFNNAPTAVTGVGAEAVPPTIQLPLPPQNNRYDISLTGQNAITDSTGRRLNALIRVQYENSGAPPTLGWRAYLVSAKDASGTELLAAPQQLGTRTGGTTTAGGITYANGIINPADAQGTAGRPIVLRPPVGGIAITGATLNPQLEFTQNSFSVSASSTSLVASGDQPFGTLGAGNPPTVPTLAQTLTDPTYYLAGTNQDDKRATDIAVRVADDQLVAIGVRADEPAFEQLVRVLRYARDQGVPLSTADLSAALTLIDQSITGLDTLRSNVAFDQLQLKDARKFHQTTISLAKNTEDQILTADPAETVAKLQSLQTTIEASYAAISQIRNLSLVNYL